MALIFFLALLLLSVYAQMAYQAKVQSDYKPSYAINADKLTEIPAKYFTVSNPDQSVLNAINGERYVFVHYDDTQIDELARQYGTNNIEYHGSYYTIYLAYVDSFPPPTLPHILAGFAISILGIVAISIFQVVRYLKQRKSRLFPEQVDTHHHLS
jgi:hypothetical protein